MAMSQLNQELKARPESYENNLLVIHRAVTNPIFASVVSMLADEVKSELCLPRSYPEQPAR